MCSLGGTRCVDLRKRMRQHDPFYDTVVTLPPYSEKTTPLASLNNFTRLRWLQLLQRTDVTDSRCADSAYYQYRVGVWHFHPEAVARAKLLTSSFSRITFDADAAESMMPILTSSERIILPGQSFGR